MKAIYDLINKIDNEQELEKLYRHIAEKIHAVRNVEIAQARLNFDIGNTVTVKAKFCKGKARKLKGISGTIKKINQKNAKVMFNENEYGGWTIPLNALDIVA